MKEKKEIIDGKKETLQKEKSPKGEKSSKKKLRRSSPPKGPKTKPTSRRKKERTPE